MNKPARRSRGSSPLPLGGEVGFPRLALCKPVGNPGEGALKPVRPRGKCSGGADLEKVVQVHETDIGAGAMPSPETLPRIFCVSRSTFSSSLGM